MQRIANCSIGISHGEDSHQPDRQRGPSAFDRLVLSRRSKQDQNKKTGWWETREDRDCEGGPVGVLQLGQANNYREVALIGGENVVFIYCTSSGLRHTSKYIVAPETNCSLSSKETQTR